MKLARKEFISFYCLAWLYFRKRKGFSKERKNKEVAIFYVPTKPLKNLERKFAEV